MTHYLTAAATRELQAKLTERDWLVLKYVAGLRFVSGGQLTRLCFAEASDSPAAARASRRALLRLARLDALARLPRSVGGVRSGSAGFVYHLGLAGQRLATTHGWQPERRGRRSLTPGTLFLRHTLQVAELHTRLIEADRSRSIELLELAPEPSCWRSYTMANGQRATLKPDSYVRLGAGDYEDSLWIEVDMGTEGSRALEGQLRQYVAYAASGIEQAERGVFPRCLWTANTAERVAVIEACIRRLPGQAHELFQVAGFEDAIAVMTSTKNSENG
jgi:Replication-relaxation